MPCLKLPAQREMFNQVWHRVGAMETRTTDVALTLTYIRSTVQVAISQGSATAKSMNGSGETGFGGWIGQMGGVVECRLRVYRRNLVEVVN